MFGTLINVMAIVAGGLAGRAMTWQPSTYVQKRLRVLLGALVLAFGFYGIGRSFEGSLGRMLAQFAVAVGAMVLGRLLGRALGLQRRLNGIGRRATALLSEAAAGKRPGFGDAFVACAGLFCLTPLAVIGSVPDGLREDFQLLAVKGAMEGLAAWAMIRSLGWGALAAALPVLAFQGTLTLIVRSLAPEMASHSMAAVLGITAGLMATSVAMLVLEIHRALRSRPVDVADYLPSLLVAPLLARWLL